MRAHDWDVRVLHREAVERAQLEALLARIFVTAHVGHMEQQEEAVLAGQPCEPRAGFAVHVPVLAFRPEFADAFRTGARAANDFAGRLVRGQVHGAEPNDASIALRRRLEHVIVVTHTQLVLSPGEAKRHADIDAGIVHARQQLLGRRDLSVRVGVHLRERGIPLRVLLTFVADIRRKNVRMEVDNHAAMIALGGPVVAIQPQATVFRKRSAVLYNGIPEGAPVWPAPRPSPSTN